jgi:hypothetical protein
VVGTFTPGTPSPVSTNFTQVAAGGGSSGSLTITNDAGQKTTCLGQFKLVTQGGNAFATGFAFPQDRNMLAIQNGTGATALKSVTIAINGLPSVRLSLTPGEMYTGDMTSDLHGLPGLNTLTITASGPAGASGEAVVWGVGPFVFPGAP